MTNKKIIIDTLSNNYPKFIDKETTRENNAWIMCEVKLKPEGKVWKGKVINISSSGKYIVELLE